MSEELGKIEKPTAESFKGTRKLYFVPLLMSTKDLPLEIAVKIDHYWDEVTTHIGNLESKLGKITRIYHELIPEGGAAGVKLLNDLNMGSKGLVESHVEKGAVLEATEDNETLAELMDWSRCLSLNLQSQNVFAKILEYYTQSNQKRNTGITERLNSTLKDNETGILIMAEGHQIQFPQDIQLFYVAPPSLDEIKRWLRDYEEKLKKAQPKEAQAPDDNLPDE
jgi:hypothetical protein